MKVVALSAALMAVLTVLAEPRAQDRSASQDKTVQTENYFPDGPGRDLIFQTCVQCHDLRNTVSQRKTAAGWKRTVDEMIWRGAPLMADEAELMTSYLASSFGPDKPIPSELRKKPTGNKP